MPLRGPDQKKRVLRISPTAENQQLPATGALILHPSQPNRFLPPRIRRCVILDIRCSVDSPNGHASAVLGPRWLRCASFAANNAHAAQDPISSGPNNIQRPHCPNTVIPPLGDSWHRYRIVSNSIGLHDPHTSPSASVK